MKNEAKAATFFRSAAAWRKWLEKYGAVEKELVVGFYRLDCGRGGITYPEALDEALCHGWIDGVRRKHADESYTVRFTPRKRRSNWSAVNIRRVKELTALGKMAEPGTRAFEARDPEAKAPYSFEQRPQSLPPELEKKFRSNAAAWAFFQAQPPGYRRMANWYVVSAAKDETRERRLAKVIADSAAGRRIM